MPSKKPVKSTAQKIAEKAVADAMRRLRDRTAKNPRSLEDVARLLYRMQIGKGKSPQAARDWAERNKQIYYRATIAADAYNAGATKEVALRKAFGKKGLREIEAGRAGSPSKMVKNPQAGKWYLPFKRGRMNYENVGHLPYLLQHDIGFSGAKLYRPVEVSGSHFVLKGDYGMTRKAALDWIKSQGTKQNPARHLPANRLTPVSFTVRGKRHTGKAKRVGNVVKVFVTPGVARKVNPWEGGKYIPEMYRDEYYEIGEVFTSPVYGQARILSRKSIGTPTKYLYTIEPVTRRERKRRSTKPYFPKK